MESPNRWFVLAVALVLVTAVAGFAYFGYLETQPCVNPGCNLPDPLTLVSSWMNSNTSITLELHNGGLHSLALVSYYIKDALGHLYSNPGWTGPTIPANSNMNITLTIDGSSFTFQPKNTYTVSTRTSENYLVTFTATT